MSLLAQALVFLAAAVVAVPISKRLGLGSVLGYLAAGVVIGPWGARLITDVENILHFAELGVVLFLFIVGLELQPSRLWELRRSVFGYGTAQVGVTALVMGALALAFGLSWQGALVAGIGLSLSSTAFALQLLAEKSELTTAHGRASFGMLLFQDLAVIPLLAALPFLAGGPGQDAASAAPMWLSGLKVLGVLAAVIAGGRYVVRPVFRFIASIHSQEVFTAAALLVVIGVALLVNQVGLSMALGAFLAGVLLADSDYRHELEADLEPFKGLLLGLFFIAVGMSVQLGLLVERPLTVVALVLGLVAVKAAILFALGKVFLKDTESSVSLALAISQGGEFAFVLFGLATGMTIVDRATSDLLIVVVGLSMAVTPMLYVPYVRFLRPKFARREDRAFDVTGEGESPVIIAGFGRVGQVVGRVLRAKKIPFTALDANPEHIDFVRKFGNKVFYGDASRLDLLRAARTEHARVFVLAIDDIAASLRTAQVVKEHFPNVTIFARARNRQHAYQLLDMGITRIMRETFSSSLEMTGEVLQALGMPFSDAKVAMDRFREHDEALLQRNYKFHSDPAKLQELAAQSRKELEELFTKDAADRKSA